MTRSSGPVTVTIHVRAAVNAPSTHSWLLLSGAVVASTVALTVGLLSAPPWPGMFADYGIAAGLEREAAIEAWVPAAREILIAGVLATLPFLLGWAAAVRADAVLRRFGAAVAAIGAISAIPGVHVFLAVPAALVWWVLLIGVQGATLTAPLWCAVALAGAEGARRHFGPRGQRVVQCMLLALIAAGWVGFSLTLFPSEGTLG
jgi:hypothetical protein